MKTDPEVIISNLLRAGVTLSAVIIITGGVIYLMKNYGSPVEYNVFHEAAGNLCSIAGIIRSLQGLDGKALIQLGIVVLIATPVARVVFSLFTFLLKRDYAYSIISLIVLGVLSYGLFGAVLR